MQTVVYYLYVMPYCGRDNLFFNSFLLLLGATGCVAGSGNIYNDIKDIKTDAYHTNKPKIVGNEISLKTAWNWVILLVCISWVFVLLGGWYYNWSSSLIFVFIIGTMLLYFYSRFIKSTILIGNLLVALLCAISIWMTTLLDPNCTILSSITEVNRTPLILGGYIANAFVITTVREIIKDKEDAKADVQAGIYTIGSTSEITFKLVFNGFILIAYSMNIIWFYLLHSILDQQQWVLGILIIFIPLILLTVVFNLPKRSNTFSFLSKLIKVYILFAILLLILWQGH